MKQSLSISTQPLKQPAMDYSYLMREGIALLEKLSGQSWTDFNAHDPGITILEQLCYAITDLSYRLNFDMKDLLANGSATPYQGLLSPAKILTTQPVTRRDLRKQLLDTAGVKNAWVDTQHTAEINNAVKLAFDGSGSVLYWNPDQLLLDQQKLNLGGLYSIQVETDNTVKTEADRDTVKQAVVQRLQACRALGEDFLEPVVLKQQKIIVRAAIEISADAEPKSLLIKIYEALAHVISPSVRFYTLGEMLAKGKTISEVIEGPALTQGFIDDTDLDGFERKQNLQVSDLLQVIMGLPSVAFVNAITLEGNGKIEDWSLKLDADLAPFLDIPTSINPNQPAIVLTRAGVDLHIELELNADGTGFKGSDQLIDLSSQTKNLTPTDLDIVMANGQFRDLGRYYSIQHQFPEIYGLGSRTIPSSFSAQRKAQIKQLKAYLMFFEQILANYFAQLSHTSQLFQFNSDASATTATYFSQLITDADTDENPNTDLGLDEILIAAQYTPAGLQAITEPGSPEARKSRFLDHLLARFGEQTTHFQYPENDQATRNAKKRAVLQAIDTLGSRRGSGFDYTQSTSNPSTSNLAGLEQRIRLILGLADSVGNEAEQFFLVEHILLRPGAGEYARQQLVLGDGLSVPFLQIKDRIDPYTHQISVVFPKRVFPNGVYSDRDKDADNSRFEQFVWRTLRQEAPAHLRIYVHWFAADDFARFKSAWQLLSSEGVSKLLSSTPSTSSNEDLLRSLNLRDARDQLTQILKLGIPYPLRDLLIDNLGIIPYNQQATITIRGGQSDVSYQLCNEIGFPLSIANQPIAAALNTQTGLVALSSPAITENKTLRILAARRVTADNKTNVYESYLTQCVDIKVGINTNLVPAFDQLQGQAINQDILSTDFGSRVSVHLDTSQPGVTYVLVMGGQAVSVPVAGNKNRITLITLPDKLITDDTTLTLMGYQADATQQTAIGRALGVLVRPNTAVTLNVNAPILNYNAQATFSLAAQGTTQLQTNVVYSLYRTQGTLDYVDSAGASTLALPAADTPSDEVASGVNWPNLPADGSVPTNVVLVGNFTLNSGQFTLAVPNLTDDAVYCLRIAKTSGPQTFTRWLTQARVVLVRPNPTITLTQANDAVLANLVQMTSSQANVKYQLRLAPNNSPVNKAGYATGSRRIERSRVGVDFAIEGQGPVEVKLPIGTTTLPATFNVLATKIRTGATAQLTQTITVA